MDIQYLDRYFHYDADMLSDDLVFVEIGSYSGGNIKRLKRKFPNCRVIVYEASRENFVQLQEKYDDMRNTDGVSIYNKAVTDKDGSVEFFEYEGAPSSNSVFERHKKKKSLVLKKSYKIDSVSLKTIMQENNVDHVDVVFANAEGVEFMILDELSEKASLRGKIGQLCLSLHERIVGKEAVDKTLGRASKFYKFKKGDGKWGSHLFRNKKFIK
jgi:FkbM family methyltransferase